MTLFCKHCGIELDEHDVDANIATWGEFRLVCMDTCIEYEDNLITGIAGINGRAE